MTSGLDFFVSYAAEDRSWAEWIAVQLEEAGHSVFYQASDFRPGRDFVHEMQSAVSSAERTIAVLSPAYLHSSFGGAEWQVAFSRDPSGRRGVLLPVRVKPCEPTGLLAMLVYVDLVDVSEPVARRKLLAAVDGRRKPVRDSPFPGAGLAIRFPGAGPDVTNLPSRNPSFMGRDAILAALDNHLRRGGVVAVEGMGGVGKSGLAIEYAYRHRADYDIVWWIGAENPASVPAQLAQLGRELGLPPSADEDAAAAATLAELRDRDRWLLIYDEADDPSELSGWVPGGPAGRVLVTTRSRDWRRRGPSVEVATWSRPESVAYLRARTRNTDEALLSELAALVGDLPLALAEAAAYLEGTGEDVAAYVALIRDRSRELFAEPGVPPDPEHQRVATVWATSLERVAAEEPAATDLLRLLAFLGPQVPRDLPLSRPDAMPEQLAAMLVNRLRYSRLLMVAAKYALVSLSPDEIRIHRLVQTVIRARMAADEEAEWVTAAVALIRATFPEDSWEPSRWPTCAQLLPHVSTVTEHAERLRLGGPEAGWLLDRASTYLRGRGHFVEAESLARRALRQTEQALGADHVDVAWRHDELGRVLRGLGRSDEARDEFERAVSIGQAHLGPDHPDVGAWRGSLGFALMDLSRPDEARMEFERALRAGLAVLGPGHPNIGSLRSNLGSALQALGRWDEAHAQFEQALAIGLATLGPDHPTTGTLRGNLARVLLSMGRADEGRAHVEQALSIKVAALGPDHPDVGLWRNNLGGVLKAVGELDRARDQFEIALSISTSALGPDHPQTVLTRRNLAEVLSSPGITPGGGTAV